VGVLHLAILSGNRNEVVAIKLKLSSPHIDYDYQLNQGTPCDSKQSVDLVIELVGTSLSPASNRHLLDKAGDCFQVVRWVAQWLI
jgi:hypothetical protein